MKLFRLIASVMTLATLTATAQNATDGLRETCVQIVVYPVDANGNIIGLPTWVNQN